MSEICLITLKRPCRFTGHTHWGTTIRRRRIDVE